MVLKTLICGVRRIVFHHTVPVKENNIIIIKRGEKNGYTGG